MFCNAINKDEINVFSGSDDLYFYVKKLSIMHLSFIKQRESYLAFPMAVQFCGKYLFIMYRAVCIWITFFIDFLSVCFQSHHEPSREIRNDSRKGL